MPFSGVCVVNSKALLRHFGGHKTGSVGVKYSGSSTVLLTLKRALRVFAAIAAWILLNVGWSYVAYLLFGRRGPGANDVGDVEQSLFTLAFIGSNLLIPILLIYYRHKRRDLWLREEAERWLAERSSPRTQLWRRRLRPLLWIPSTVALVVFLFLPELMGVTSHLYSGSTFILNGHRIHPPLTSFIRGNDVGVRALIGRGIARVGFREAFSSQLLFYAATKTDKPLSLYSNEVALETRTLPFGRETLTCRHIGWKSDPKQSEFINIRCIASTNDFGATLWGSPADVNIFYRVLQNATE
jgi:hypothetical protein